MKHQFAVRMMDVKTALPMQKLFLYETDNQQLTLDDFIEINNINPQFQLVCYFYIGFMNQADVLEKYDPNLFRK